MGPKSSNFSDRIPATFLFFLITRSLGDRPTETRFSSYTNPVQTQSNIHAESLLQQNEDILLYALKMGAVRSPTTLVLSTRLHGINVPDF